MLKSLSAGNKLLAFILELAMLAAFAYAGWNGPNVLWLRIVLVIALPGLAILLWAVWAAPRAGKRRLKMPALLIFKVAIYAAATAAWWVAGQPFIAAVFGTLVVINLVAGTLFGEV